MEELGVGMLVICEATNWMAQAGGGAGGEELGKETAPELLLMEEASWRSCIRTLESFESQAGESVHQHPWALATRRARRRSRAREWPHLLAGGLSRSLSG